ncbi:MAG: hypothetical protein ACOY0T_08550 [Myxococcota bacterium]
MIQGIVGGTTERSVAGLDERSTAAREHEMFERGLEWTLSDLERITRIADAPLRNLLITQRYADLSRALTRVLGPSDANWSTFATWASKTAGESIRGEEVPREVQELLEEEERFEAALARLTRPILGMRWLSVDIETFDLIRAIVAEVSHQIAEGNLKVFAELTPLFARFVFAFRDHADRTPENLASFLSILRPGSVADGGQDLLKSAFTYYFEASCSNDPKVRAEFTLHGNLLIGLHEQTRLQANIQGGIDAPISDRVYSQFKTGLPSLLKPLLDLLFRHRVQNFHNHLAEVWERVATRFFMRLALPRGASLALGEDIPQRGQRPFPEVLDPLVDLALLELVKSYDPNIESTEGSAAANWVILHDRMGFICDLFRSCQRDGTLFDDPFELIQRLEFEAGRMPKGKL